MCAENNFSHVVADVFGLDSAEDTKVKYQDMPPAHACLYTSYIS